MILRWHFALLWAHLTYQIGRKTQLKTDVVYPDHPKMDCKFDPSVLTRMRGLRSVRESLTRSIFSVYRSVPKWTAVLSMDVIQDIAWWEIARAPPVRMDAGLPLHQHVLISMNVSQSRAFVVKTNVLTKWVDLSVKKTMMVSFELPDVGDRSSRRNTYVDDKFVRFFLYLSMIAYIISAPKMPPT